MEQLFTEIFPIFFKEWKRRNGEVTILKRPQLESPGSSSNPPK
jgi:hypothetical protein